MHGTVIEAQRVRDAKEKIFGRTWEGQGHLERCTVSSRVRESLPGGPAEGTPCARVEKHEATWPFVSRSDSENTIAGVKGTFPGHASPGIPDSSKCLCHLWSHETHLAVIVYDESLPRLLSAAGHPASSRRL